MPKAYTSDRRGRVIARVESGGSRHEVAPGHFRSERSQVRQRANTLRLEKEEILRDAVARLLRVAEAVARMSPEKQARALELAERTYLNTALELNYTEQEAKSWASAMMFRLHREIDLRRSNPRGSAS